MLGPLWFLVVVVCVAYTACMKTIEKIKFKLWEDFLDWDFPKTQPWNPVILFLGMCMSEWVNECMLACACIIACASPVVCMQSSLELMFYEQPSHWNKLLKWRMCVGHVDPTSNAPNSWVTGLLWMNMLRKISLELMFYKQPSHWNKLFKLWMCMGYVDPGSNAPNNCMMGLLWMTTKKNSCNLTRNFPPSWVPARE